MNNKKQGWEKSVIFFTKLWMINMPHRGGSYVPDSQWYIVETHCTLRRTNMMNHKPQFSSISRISAYFLRLISKSLWKRARKKERACQTETLRHTWDTSLNDPVVFANIWEPIKPIRLNGCGQLHPTGWRRRRETARKPKLMSIIQSLYQ